ncbi:hypothetical protein BSL78_02311 [Apostichopus japonicus]|uniref:Ig-like domain-containing protein n=1 Tax=Stichopus japonicus TaxID=307972 RepID=A0A2G8LKG0_STIJA|nr:hypothetical protein BSL78_02311 [Apostichopus japonicus]
MKERKTGKMDVFHTLLRLLVWFVFTKEEKSLLWTRTDENETILFRDDIRRFNEREHSINVNDDHCHIQNYSLKLSNMPANDSSGQYTCWYNGSVVTTFCVLLQVVPQLNIKQNGIIISRYHKSSVALQQHLLCYAYNVYTPCVIIWQVNGNIVQSESIRNNGRIVLINVTSTFDQTLSSSTLSITCMVESAILADQSASVTINVVEATENRPVLTHFIEFFRNLFAAVIALGIFCVGIAVGKRICKKTTEPSAAVSSAVERGWSRLSSRILERTRRRYNRCEVDVSRCYNTLSRPPALPSNNAIEAERAVCLSPDTSATGASSSREDPTYIDIYEMVDKGVQNGSPRDASN